MKNKFRMALFFLLIPILISCSKSDVGHISGNVLYFSGKGVHFDGKDSTVAIPQSPKLNVGKQVTIVFWMKPDADNQLENYQGLVTSDFYHIEISDGINFVISTTRGRSFTETKFANGGHGPMVSSGEWHHVAGTYDGTKLQLYIDGEPSGNPMRHKGSISPMDSESFVAIGSEDGRLSDPSLVGTRYFRGHIDDVGIFNRALSASEIAAIYQSSKSKHD
jgi:hypothetical protein